MINLARLEVTVGEIEGKLDGVIEVVDKRDRTSPNAE